MMPVFSKECSGAEIQNATEAEGRGFSAYGSGLGMRFRFSAYGSGLGMRFRICGLGCRVWRNIRNRTWKRTSRT